jgi:hypothetical protein
MSRGFTLTSQIDSPEEIDDDSWTKYPLVAATDLPLDCNLGSPVSTHMIHPAPQLRLTRQPPATGDTSTHLRVGRGLTPGIRSPVPPTIPALGRGGTTAPTVTRPALVLVGQGTVDETRTVVRSGGGRGGGEEGVRLPPIMAITREPSTTLYLTIGAGFP